MPEHEPISKPVSSNQTGVHSKLTEVVTKHLHTRYRRPFAEHTQKVFNEVQQHIEATDYASIILDSCCGTGLSTRIIAESNPHALVIGVDRSAKRLSKEYSDRIPENVLLIQAECADFWRLVEQANWKIDKHYILYPNPYPKSIHLKRRWHAHPVLPSMLNLGGKLELRTNWLIYAQEFQQACALAKPELAIDDTVTSFIPDKFLTLFEQKYHQSGQRLYRVVINLNQ